MPSNQKAQWVADIEFIFAECVRIRRTIDLALKSPASLKNLPQDDMWGDLPDPRGDGKMMCGRAADRRVWQLAEQAIKKSDAIGTIEISPVHKALGRILVQNFIKEKREVSERQAEKALAAAVREVKRTRMDRVHYIPCRLMYSKGPSHFTIGPVTFYTLDRFNEFMTPKFEAYEQKGGSHRAKLLSDAKHYYDGFTWIGEVEIFNCDGGISLERARTAVTAAVNLLHILFGAYFTRRMDVGGPRLKTDRRAHMSIDAKHHLYISCSSASTSAVGFSEDWGKYLEGEDMAVLLRGAQKALETVANPAIKRPLGARLLDSAAWFGQAVRETSPAAQIVKAVTALEALVLTSEHEDIKKTVSNRGAAICYNPNKDETFEELKDGLAEAYSMRSRLAHGSLSPFAPELTSFAPVCLERIERVINWGLGLFESHELFDRDLTTRQLADGLDQLVSLASNNEERRTRAQTTTAS